MNFDFSIETTLRQGDQLISLKASEVDIDDPDYVEGAIIWRIGKEELLSAEHWDLVDQLWIYLVDGLPQYRESGEFSTFFPDQPLKIEFQRLDHGWTRVLVGSDRHCVPSQLFEESMLTGAREFFVEMKRLVPSKTSLWDAYIRKVS